MGDRTREPLWESMREYQKHIEPDMIISIIPDERYTGKQITDWKIEKLAFAMANAEQGGLSRPLSYGLLTVQMDTAGTEIDSYMRLALATQGNEKKFIVYFTLTIMRNGERYTAVSFSGEGLNEWAMSVGIADKECW